jgi:hypothetical protein
MAALSRPIVMLKGPPLFAVRFGSRLTHPARMSISSIVSINRYSDGFTLRMFDTDISQLSTAFCRQLNIRLLKYPNAARLPRAIKR